eukprot:1138198-Pelagomonas_calceolata.AAC.10
MGTAERVLLPGYGVEAVLKNTEYSAMDEKDRDAERRSKAGAGGEDAGASEEEVQKLYVQPWTKELRLKALEHALEDLMTTRQTINEVKFYCSAKQQVANDLPPPDAGKRTKKQFCPPALIANKCRYSWTEELGLKAHAHARISRRAFLSPASTWAHPWPESASLPSTLKLDELHGATLLGQVGGFDFDTLVARKPELREELLTLRDHLLSADEEEEAVKVKELTKKRRQ